MQRLTTTRREFYAAWVSPLAVLPVFAVLLYVGQYGDPAGMFSALWVMVVVAYPTMFFLALPAWRNATERGAVSWTRVLLYGAALGSIVPFLMAVVLVCVALRDGRKYGVLSAVQECLAMLVLGLVCGIAIAITFRLIAGSPKAVP